MVVSAYISYFSGFSLHENIDMSCLFLMLQIIYKQVGVYSEMCGDIDTDGRSAQSLFHFFKWII